MAFAIGLAACAHPHPQSGAAPLSDGAVTGSNPTPPLSRQLLVVTSADWDTVPARLFRFTRADAGDAWHAAGPPVAVVLGRTGLAWGAGLNNASREMGPVKHEGDGRSPAGMFRLGSAFGFGPPDTIGVLAMPYRRLTATTDCVDDVRSSFYNTLAERDASGQSAWSSAEHMRQIDPDYRYGIFVEHNTTPRTPGLGSCIFIHIWEGPTKPTSGCTALDPGRLADLLRWLSGAANPVLVQLPRQTYDSHREAWALPSLPPATPTDR